MATIREVAVRTEEVLDEQSVGWAMPAARLYAVTNGSNGFRVDYANESPDVYDLLERSDSALTAMTAEYIAVVTCGWAAPVAEDDEETRPSLHPERRRVRLVIVVNKDEMASVLRFEDAPTDPIVDEGNAHGSLADAMRSLMRSAHGE